MRKKIFAIMIVAVVTAFAGYNIYQSQNTATLSDLALANVEALAYTESGFTYECSMSGCVFDFNHDCHVYRFGQEVLTCEYSRG